MSASAAQLIRKAERQTKAGDMAAAAAHYKSVLEKFPDNARAAKGLRAIEGKLRPQTNAFAAPPDVLRKLIKLVDAGKLDSAIEHAQAVLSAFPLSAAIYNVIAVAHMKSARFDEAIAAGRQAIAVDPKFKEAHNNLGSALKAAGRVDEAMESYKAAIKAAPDFVDAHVNLGVVYTHLGDKKNAIAAFENALCFEPTHARAHHYLSDVKKYEPQDAQIDAMRQLLGRKELTDEARVHLNYALGKAMDDLKRYDDAFQHFSDGARIRKSITGYSIDEDRALFDDIKDAHRAALAVSCGVYDAPTPVFVVGMPRSGTSLVEQILASHSLVAGVGELDWLGREIKARGGVKTCVGAEQFEEIGNNYRARLRDRAGGAAFATDKLPINFRWIGVIRRALPDAKIVLVKRDPRAVCWSIFRRSFATSKGNGYTDSLEDLAAYYTLFEELTAFWDSEFPGAVHRINYERLTENQEAETRRLLGYVGLDFEAACLAFHENERAVATASAMQVRSKLYRGSSDAWRNYEAHLGPLLAGLPSPQ